MLHDAHRRWSYIVRKAHISAEICNTRFIYICVFATMRRNFEHVMQWWFNQSLRRRFAVMQRSLRRNGRFPPQGRVSECIRTSLGGGYTTFQNEKSAVLGASAGEIPQRVRCGLGITFREDSHGRLHVHALSPGGGAEIGGDIISGDVLVEINGQDVSKLLMGEMADHCIGFPGDQVGYHRVFHTEFAIFFLA